MKWSASARGERRNGVVKAIGKQLQWLLAAWVGEIEGRKTFVLQRPLHLSERARGSCHAVEKHHGLCGGFGHTTARAAPWGASSLASAVDAT